MPPMAADDDGTPRRTISVSDGSGDASAILERGATVGRYLILGQLGAGGMGVVYSAYDPELERKVAIKILRREGASDQSRMRREAQAMARLQHPNVIAVYDVGLFADRVFVAMELVDGTTLTEWLEAAPRPWLEIVAVMSQAGRGLAAAHAVGLVHRDFKLSNVLRA
jgi:serine/threonine protein kinase